MGAGGMAALVATLIGKPFMLYPKYLMLSCGNGQYKKRRI